MSDNWDKKHLIDIEPLSREDIEELFELTDILLPYSGIDKSIPASERRTTDILKGKIEKQWYGEMSTRTYGSSETAIERLGGSALRFDEKLSSLKKKESIKHTALVLSDQADIIVDRHKDPRHIYELAKYSHVPVINAGNGSWQHPTQTLLDLYTMDKECGIDGKRVVLLGDLRYGRTTHSLIRGLGKFSNVEVHGISPPGLEMPEEHIKGVDYYPHTIGMRYLKQALEEIYPHYVYATRPQLERIPWYRKFLRENSYRYQISKDTLENLPEVRIMHPLPIATGTKHGPEIATELDGDPRAIYFKQAAYGIPTRMAAICILLGYEDQVKSLSISAGSRTKR